MGHTTGADYSTPVMYDYRGKRHAILSSWKGIYSVEVETGNVLWLYEWEIYSCCQVADPLVFDNKVFVLPFVKPDCALLDIGGEEPKVLWRDRDIFSETCNAVMIDGYIYLCEGGPDVGRVILKCLDAQTGEVMWNEDLDRYRVKSLAGTADGKLIILDDIGNLYIAEANPSSYKEISSAKIIEGAIHKFWTPPVLYNGKIYCRDLKGPLVCLDVSK